MELSEQEQKMVTYLRKQHQAWPVMRWIILISSLVILAVMVGGWVKETAYYVFAAYGLSYSLGKWRGRPEITLLLKLVEGQQK